RRPGGTRCSRGRTRSSAWSGIPASPRAPPAARATSTADTHGCAGPANGAASPASSRTCSRAWRPGGEPRVRGRGQRIPPRRRGSRDRRQEARPRTGALGDPRRWTPPDRGRTGSGEDADCEVLRGGPRPLLPEDPVHPGPPARGHHGHLRVRPQDERLRPPPRSDLHTAAPGGRDQPRPPEDAVRLARGDAGTAGDPRGRDVSPRTAVLRDRDPESDRTRRHLPTPGGPGGPVPPADRRRLSDAGTGGRGPRTPAEAPVGRRNDRTGDDAGPGAGVAGRD